MCVETFYKTHKLVQMQPVYPAYMPIPCSPALGSRAGKGVELTGRPVGDSGEASA